MTPVNEGRRRPRYWIVRSTVAVAVVGPPALFLVLAVAAPHTMGPGVSLLSWEPVPILAVGAALWLAGATWTIRIFRGLSDDPPPWRYRDR
jgi:hypothetical protein